MKLYCFSFLLLSFVTTVLEAQTQTMVVKTTGDTIYCDKITAGGKNIICETAGQKTKLKATEVSYFIQPYQMMMADGEPPLWHDTIRKCFVPTDGKIHEVLMENDSYYLTGTMTTYLLGRNKYEEYYIMSKKNVQIELIIQNKTLPDILLKYFGGTCPEFDAKVKAAKPKFDNKIFPWLLFADLLDFYNRSCK